MSRGELIGDERRPETPWAQFGHNFGSCGAGGRDK